MRTIVHLSDLHFGAVDPDVVSALIDYIPSLRPDVIAVSGDLTQRARSAQFRSARAFLDALPRPQLVVPGNHDVPLYNVLARFGEPLRGFHRHITSERYPCISDSEIAVIGADTTRSFTIQDGGLRPVDVGRLCALLGEVGAGAVRVIVCHHPFDPLVGRRARWTMPAPDAQAVNTLIARGADIFLTGHRHLSYVGHTAIRYQVQGRSAIVVEAGTATSIRGRGERNSFNILRIGGEQVVVERLEWDPAAGRFAVSHSERFDRAEEGWRPGDSCRS
jgi:3',5'-cyclic AMP phosphodiesterase CpdA